MRLSGGRPRGGGTPDPNALRRDRERPGAGGIAILPSAGRDGPPPEWPLVRPARRELVLWAREWRRPQAVIWERNQQDIEVAFYVRAMRTNLRQQMDSLALTLPGLRSARFVIADPDAAAPLVELRPFAEDARSRFAALGEPTPQPGA
jgi:hypothetical protein